MLCEKPLANTVAEARGHGRGRGGRAGPGVRVDGRLQLPPGAGGRTDAPACVAAGRIGTIRHVRALYLQDWIVDPEFPLVWRLRKEEAGSGALGDIGAHIIDLTQFVTGQRSDRGQRADRDVHQAAAAAVGQRPGCRASGGTGRSATSPWTTPRCSSARLDGGALATYEATRFATGRKNALRVEVNGSLGSLAFDLERLNELEFYDGTGRTARAGLHGGSW